jgi:hypothetical protein
LAYPEGSPHGLTEAADRLSNLGNRVARAAADIARSASVSGWQGHRYEVFIAASRSLSSSLESGASALSRASSSLAQLGTHLANVQRRIKSWAEEIEMAEEQLRSAERELHAVRSENLVTPLPGSARLERAEAACRRATAELEELRERYLPKARQLCQDLRQDDERAAAALRAAAETAPRTSASGSLPLPEVKADASAGFGNRDGAVGAHASASIEMILATLHKRFGDDMSSVDFTASAGANAEASARAEVGPDGAHLDAGVDAQAGGKATVESTLGHEDVFQLKPSIDGRVGPGFEARAGIHVDEDGLHLGADFGASPIVGGGVHLEADVDPGGIMQAVKDAPRTVEKIVNILG